MPRSRALIWLSAIVIGVGVALTIAFGPANEGKPSFYAWAGLPYAAIAIAVGARAYNKGELGAWIRPQWGDITRGFLSGCVLFALAYGFIKVAVPQGSPKEAWLGRIYIQIGDPRMLRDHMALVAIGIVLAAAAEEIVWRGLVQDLLGELVGSRRAWIAAAVLYALAHAGTAFALADDAAGPNPMMVIAALGAGLFWGAMRRAFDRLVPGIIAHAMFDWAAIMMFRLYGPSV
jgi:membrane protease YdiL (CAAX protease family)